ncbi:sensitive to high expression protein 9, mitochondrial [Diutina catenulata]
MFRLALRTVAARPPRSLWWMRAKSTIGEAINQKPRTIAGDQSDPLANSDANIKRLNLEEQLKRAKVQRDLLEDQISQLNESVDQPLPEGGEVDPESEHQLEEELKDLGKEESSDAEDVSDKAAMAATSAKESGKDIPNISQQVNEEIHREIEDLPSAMEARKAEWSKSLSRHFESFQTTILTATRALNDATGYSAIEKLKKSIDNLEEDLKEAKQQVKDGKQVYGDAIQLRSTSQREINELLTRKHQWSSADLERFTDLYRNDHTNELREKEAADNLSQAEQRVDAIQLKLTQSILTRYHEEQIWSDKIRRASTWGTWILMGINLLLFVVATFFVEPWRRKRLVDAFEAQVRQTMIGVREGDKQIIEEVEKLKTVDEASTLAEVQDFVSDAVHMADTTPEVEREYEKERARSEAIAGKTDVEAAHTQQEIEGPPPAGMVESAKRLARQVRYDLSAWWSHLVSVMLTPMSLRKLDLTVAVSLGTVVGGILGSIMTSYHR